MDIDCTLAGLSLSRLHACADANPQRDTIAHHYRHANKHRYPYQHAIPDPHGDENARTIPNGYTYAPTH
jgi:hypothetical protein